MYKKVRDKKIILGVLAVAAVLIGQVKIVYAESTIIRMLSGGLYYVALGMAYLMGKIGSVLYVFFAGLIDIALQANALILSSPIVENGRTIVLSFTNLGFVLAIIVIAFATIFRQQSYAMKEILWKLIVAALLVNFSLVIAGAFINVADTVTNTFNSKLKGMTSDALTQILQPQALPAILSEKSGTPWAELYSRTVLSSLDIINPFYWLGYTKGLEVGQWGEDKEPNAAGLLTMIAAIIFPVVFTFLSALVLLAIAIMLFIRYLALGILLILSPIVWLLWIFPGTQSYWQKWWDNFLRWTFFAPIMMFFLYVAIVSTSVGKSTNLSGVDFKKSQQFTIDLAKKQEGLPIDIAKFGNSVIVIGLILASLIAANSMGIHGSALAMKVAKGAGKRMGGAVGKAGGWAGRKTYEKTAGRAMGSEKVKGWTEKLAGSKFIGARLLGTGLNRLGMKSETLMQNQYKDLAKGMTPERLNNEILASRGAKRAALIKEAAGRKDINMEKLAPILNNPEEMGKILGDLKKTGLNFKDVEKAVGRSFEMMTAKTDEELISATDKFVQSLTPKDFAKGQWNDTFKETSDPRLKNMQNQLAGSFAQYSPGAFAKIAPHIKTENLGNFTGIAEMQAMLLTKYQHADKEIEQKMRKQGDLALKALNKTLDRRAMFGEEAWTPTSPKEEV